MAFKNYSSNKKKNSELKYEILEKFGELDVEGKYTKELRLISWNGNIPVYDLRGWWTDEKTGEEKMTKGITLNSEELESLYEILMKMSNNERNK